VYVSTPWGVAVATIFPEHAVAALQDADTMSDILALPAQGEGGEAGATAGAAGVVAFVQQAEGSVGSLLDAGAAGTGAGAGGGSGSGWSGSGSSSLAKSAKRLGEKAGSLAASLGLQAAVKGVSGSGGLGGSGRGSPGLTSVASSSSDAPSACGGSSSGAAPLGVAHSERLFVAVKVRVQRAAAPATAAAAGTGSSAVLALPALQGTEGPVAAVPHGPGSGPAASPGPGAAAPGTGQAAVLVLLLAVAGVQLWQAPLAAGVCAACLLVALCLLQPALLPQLVAQLAGGQPASSALQMQRLPGGSGGGGGSPAPVPASPGTSSGVGPPAGGWVLTLVDASLMRVPSAYLQLQVGCSWAAAGVVHPALHALPALPPPPHTHTLAAAVHSASQQ
jgi:hypothetical protein